MTGMVANIIGGVGIFLLGMILMTDGLKAVAGDRLKRWLGQFTNNTFSSITSGAVVTATIQSSTATSLMVIGFVSAGLISFEQAVGVIIGANLGSTATSWIVSLLGLKFSVSVVALPIVGIGVFARLLRKGRIGDLGGILAGFGLIFVGIDILQSGMGNLSSLVNLEGFNSGFIGNLLLVFIGFVMTVILQASSAAIAITMTALFSGAIGLEQAMALVIGQNIGTTVTALVSALGASLPAKRTAMAHFMFNAIAGIVTLILLPLFIHFMHYLEMKLGITDDATMLALFHTVFNIFGLLLVVPILKPFTNVIIRMLPEKELLITRHLDLVAAKYAPVAVDASRKTLIEIFGVSTKILSDLMNNNTANYQKDKELADTALLKTREFINHIKTGSNSPIEYRDMISVLHAMDHISRLLKTLNEDSSKHVIQNNEVIANITENLKVAIEKLQEINQTENPKELIEFMENISTTIAGIRKRMREDLLEKTATGMMDTEKGIKEINALLWFDRIGYHLWRATVHLINDETAQEIVEENDHMLFEAN